MCGITRQLVCCGRTDRARPRCLNLARGVPSRPHDMELGLSPRDGRKKAAPCGCGFEEEGRAGYLPVGCMLGGGRMATELSATFLPAISTMRWISISALRRLTLASS